MTPHESKQETLDAIAAAAFYIVKANLDVESEKCLLFIFWVFFPQPNVPKHLLHARYILPNGDLNH